MTYKIRNSFLLLLTAVIWGCAFVAQSIGMEYIGPFTFNAVRFPMGALVLLPVILWRRRTQPVKTKPQRRELLLAGMLCGLLLCTATNLQQLGIVHSSAGKAGFLTALYIVLVPVFGLFLRKKAGVRLWLGVMLALFGLYLLCVTDNSLAFRKSDLLLLAGAFIFSWHILVIDYFAQRVDGVQMSCIQFLVSGALSAVLMLFFEKPHGAQLFAASGALLYAGILSCGVAYTLQIVGQKGMNPTVASLILSLESVVSVLAGWVLLHERLSMRELCGCVLMFAAIILAQLPDRKNVS